MQFVASAATDFPITSSHRFLRLLFGNTAAVKKRISANAGRCRDIRNHPKLNSFAQPQSVVAKPIGATANDPPVVVSPAEKRLPSTHAPVGANRRRDGETTADVTKASWHMPIVSPNPGMIGGHAVALRTLRPPSWPCSAKRHRRFVSIKTVPEQFVSEVCDTGIGSQSPSIPALRNKLQMASLFGGKALHAVDHRALSGCYR